MAAVRRRPLVVAIGTRGDLQPHVPFALAMLEAGYAPRFCSQLHHRTVATDHGIPFSSILEGDDDWRFASDYNDHLEHFAEWTDFYAQHLGAIKRRIAKVVMEHEADHSATPIRRARFSNTLARCSVCSLRLQLLLLCTSASS